MPSIVQNLSDEELARRACAGSAPCFEAIVHRYQSPLARFLTRRFPSRRDVEDILQDTFVKAWQSLHRYEDRYLFRTWLYTIAYRLAVSRGRRETIPPRSLPEQASDTAPLPAAAMEREDNRSSLWQKAADVLTEEQYTALWLHYVDEIPAGDVAKILNRSWVSVKTLMHRARKKLMPHLEAEAPARINGALQVLADNRALSTSRKQALTVKAGDL